MTYDLHGVWDAASLFLGSYINPHTNVTEIDMGPDLLWRAGVEPAKVDLGLAWYGRSFTLSDPSCNTPNGVCQFIGGANAGPCTDASGILDLEEIENIITTNSLTPKRTFANSRCLGGTMIWAIDQRDQTADNGLAAAPGITTQNQADAKQMSDNLAAGVTRYTTDCNVACKTGTNEVTQMDGQPNQLSTNGRCSAGQHRSLW
ncbi:glycoside hydrolase superfamily [Hyaloscypha finlandica]|nr:glycoside hydrolase superfamily [Hyaloscypha finlandica]